MSVRNDAETIIRDTLAACRPDQAVRRALGGKVFSSGRLLLVAIGKAAWQMASCAAAELGDRLEEGIVITKYRHSQGPIPRCTIYEAGHPVPDDNSYRATAAALALVRDLSPEDTVLFLVSGGGSALFESPLIPPADLAELTERLLACGADIHEINILRKRFSAVKGGRFAAACAPARVYAVLLSDVLGDAPDTIASGPASPDRTTCADAAAVAEKYALPLTAEMKRLLQAETPKVLHNVETVVAGSVRTLCTAASEACRRLGYTPCLLTDQLCCEAREAGSFLASIARSHQDSAVSLAFLAGGETVVHLRGRGRGGRNQELALSAAAGLAGTWDTVLFSLGSDGTDGPTDAAGGLVDGETLSILQAKGISLHRALQNNDAYTALQAAGSLLITGPTGTNLNDVAVVLIRR